MQVKQLQAHLLPVHAHQVGHDPVQHHARPAGFGRKLMHDAEIESNAAGDIERNQRFGDSGAKDVRRIRDRSRC